MLTHRNCVYALNRTPAPKNHTRTPAARWCVAFSERECPLWLSGCYVVASLAIN